MIQSTSPVDDECPNSSTASVLQVIRQALPASDRGCRLRWNHRLSDLGISSLRLLALIMDLEERFALSLEALARLSTHSTLGSVVQACLHAEALCEDAVTIH